MYSDTDFTEDERAMLADLERQETQATEPAEQPGDTDTQQGEPTQAAAQEAPAGEATDQAQQEPAQAAAAEPEKDPQAQAAQDQGKKPGDLRNALRASRRAERAAREEAERLRQEVEDLKAGKKSDSDAPGLTEEELAELEVDFPAQAAAIRKLNATVQKLTQVAAPAPAAPAPEDFIPETLPPQLQEVVDEIPELLDMQNDPDQTRWQLAVEADRLLFKSPKWSGQPLAKRLAEAARIANEQAGIVAAPQPSPASAPSPQPQSDGGKSSLEQARKRIEQATTPAPASISDIRGGASPSSKTTPDYSRMSDDEIMSSLG